MGKMGGVDTLMPPSPADNGFSATAAPKTVLAAVSSAPLGTVQATILADQTVVAEVFAEANQKKVMNSAWKFTPDYLFYLGRKGVVSDVGGEAVRISFEDANGSSSLWFPSGAVGQFLLPAAPPARPAPPPQEQKLEMLITRSPPPALAMTLIDVARAYPQLYDLIGSKLVFHNRNLCGAGGFIPPSPNAGRAHGGGHHGYGSGGISPGAYSTPSYSSPMYSEMPSSTSSLGAASFPPSVEKKSSLAERTRWSSCLSEASLREAAMPMPPPMPSTWTPGAGSLRNGASTPGSVGAATPTRSVLDPNSSPFRSTSEVTRQRLEVGGAIDSPFAPLSVAAAHGNGNGTSPKVTLPRAPLMKSTPTSPDTADSLTSSGIAHINSVLSGSSAGGACGVSKAPGAEKSGDAGRGVDAGGAEWGEVNLVSQMLEDIFQEGTSESS